MLDNNSLIKYFVRVPDGTPFNGAQVSNANATNQKKIYFDENTQQIWVKGKAFSLDQNSRSALNTLIGSDTNMSVRAIAQDVVANIASWQGADANEVIDTLKEVLTWFNNLPEGDEGALALVTRVGKPAVLYTAEDEAENSEHVAGTVKTPATGLYKEIADSVSAKNVTAAAAQDELLVSASASNNNVVVSSTSKLQNAVTAAEASIQGITVAGKSLTVTGDANDKTAEITKAELQGALFDNTYESSPLTYSYLGVTVSLKESNGELTYLNVDPTELANRVSAVEEFDPWEEYSAPASPEPGE